VTFALSQIQMMRLIEKGWEAFIFDSMNYENPRFR
jgi:hypothetical protein